MGRASLTVFLVAIALIHGARAVPRVTVNARALPSITSSATDGSSGGSNADVNDPVSSYIGGLSPSGEGLRIHGNSHAGDAFDFSGLAARLAASGSVNHNADTAAAASDPSNRPRNWLDLMSSGRGVSMDVLLKNLLSAPRSQVAGTASEVASAMQSISGVRDRDRASPPTNANLAVAMDNISNMIGIPAGRGGPKEDLSVPDMSQHLNSTSSSQGGSHNGGGLRPIEEADPHGTQVTDRTSFHFSGLGTMFASDSSIVTG